MKIRHIILASLAAAAFTACSDVKEDDRLIDTGVFNPARAILLEDFTGQNCVNCPEAHERIEELEKQYGDSLIPVSIHAGGLAITERRGGLANAQGEEYNAYYGLDAWPRGIINLVNNVLPLATWPADVRSAMSSPSTATVLAEAEVKDGNIDISISVNTSLDGKAKVMAWILENGIVAYQKKQNADGSIVEIDDYVHNNVFRASVPSTWGDEADFTAGQVADFAYSQPLGEKWNSANLTLVAIVYDANGLMGIRRVKVVDPNAPAEPETSEE